MKEYIIMFDCKTTGTAGKEAFRQAAANARPAIQAIVARTGGEILKDGSDFGVPGAKGQYAPFVLVKATEEAAKEIAGIKGVACVSENETKGPLKGAQPSGPK